MPEEMTIEQYRKMMGLTIDSRASTMTTDEYHAMLGSTPDAMPAEMTLDEYHDWQRQHPEPKGEGRDYKADLEQQLRDAGIAEPVREFRFAAPMRQWEFDYCWPERMAALEYEGLGWQGEKSRHTSPMGYTEDCVKYSTAAIMGWKVIRVTAPMVDDGRARALVLRALESEASHETL